MSKSELPAPFTLYPGWLAPGVLLLFYAGVVLRTLANAAIRSSLSVYLLLESLYLILFVLILWRPVRRSSRCHLYLLVQGLLVFGLHALRFRFDFITILYILLCYQAALLVRPPGRWIWISIFLLLTCVPLMVTLGVLQGLAAALMPMMICLVFPAYVTVTQEIESGLRRSRALLAELQSANRQLTVDADQVEELAAIHERNRLARELHNSVSQTVFSISLQTRAAQILLERDPATLQPQLEGLKALSHSALEEMRSLITQLRPQPGESAVRTTP